jgi:glycosyltransferase involved in cell wall biosynthesis
MRVLVNGLAAAGPMTGVGHYITQLLRCLREQPGGEEIDSFPSGWLCQARAWWAQTRGWLERGSASRRPTEPVAVGSGWCDRALSSLRSSAHQVLSHQFHHTCRRGRYDLYHEPNYIPLPTDLPTVATIHDLSALLHPEWHPVDRVAHFEQRFRRGLSQCRHFLAISEFGRQQLINTLHLRPDQVTRTYMGIRPGLQPLPDAVVRQVLHRLGLPPRYLLYLGTIEPRKNVLTLLRAYCAMPGSLRREYPLVLVGSWGWNAGDVADFLDQAGENSGVRHIGYVAEQHLGALYNGARALVFPSFYEGFGLPPVEMLACGGAVLASTAGAVVETVGRQAHLIESLDVDGWRDAMQRVIRDDDWWASLRRGAVDVARPFTWEQCAADTVRVYRSLCGAGGTEETRTMSLHKIAG